MRVRILIVDDNPINLKLAAALLEYAGYQVDLARDAEAAIKSIALNSPALVLLDLQLPKMDGWTLARKIKSDATTRHIHVVALTAFAMKGDQQRALDAGCDGYLSKPIDAEEFPAQVAAFLKGEAGSIVVSKAD